MKRMPSSSSRATDDLTDESPLVTSKISLIAEELMRPSTTKDFSCSAFDDEGDFEFFLSALDRKEGVEVLVLQGMSAPFGQEHRLLEIVRRNPTPIQEVVLTASSFAAYPKLVEQIHATCRSNKQRAEQSHAELTQRLEKRQTRQQREAALDLSQSLLTVWNQKTAVMVKEEYSARRQLQSAWRLLSESMRSVELAQSYRQMYARLFEQLRREQQTAFELIVMSEAVERQHHCMHMEHREREMLVEDVEHNERKQLRFLYSENWRLTNVLVRSRLAKYSMQLREVELCSRRQRESTLKEESDERVALHRQAAQSLQVIAKNASDVRVRKDDEHRRQRQRRVEEEFSLEQAKNKAKMELAMMHANTKSSGNIRLVNPKMMQLADEEPIRRYLEECQLEIFEAIVSMRKIAQRYVERESSIRNAIRKYQVVIAEPPQCKLQISAEAPPSVFYEGQRTPLAVEPTFTLTCKMESFWSVRCAILREEITKCVAPLRQVRKEASVQIYNLLCEVERCLRNLGMNLGMVWTHQLRQTFITLTNPAPIFEFAEQLLSDTLIDDVRRCQETIFGGELSVQLDAGDVQLGALCLDEESIVSVYNRKRLRMFGSGKPLHLWTCTSSAPVSEIAVAEFCPVVEQEKLESTLANHSNWVRGLLGMPPTTLVPSLSEQRAERREGTDDSSCANDDAPLHLSTEEQTLLTTSFMEARSFRGSTLQAHPSHKITFQIPTGTRPEQLEALVRSVRFLPSPNLGTILTEAVISRIVVDIQLFTKSRRYRPLPPTNWTLNGSSLPVVITNTPAQSPDSKSKRSSQNANGSGASSPVTAVQPTVTVPVTEPSNVIAAACVKRPNPLKRLALHRHTNAVILAFVIAEKLVVFDDTVTQTHDARGGSLPLLPRTTFALHEPPVIRRSGRDPFQLRLFQLTDNAQNSRRKTSLIESGDNDLLQWAEVSALLHIDRHGGKLSPKSAMEATTNSKNLDAHATREHRSPFRGVRLSVVLEQFATQTSEDMIFVATTDELLAKHGQIFLVVPPVVGGGSSILGNDADELMESGSFKETNATPWNYADPFGEDADDQSASTSPAKPARPTRGSVTLVEPEASVHAKQEASFKREDSLTRRGSNSGQCLGVQIANYVAVPQHLSITFLESPLVTSEVVGKVLRSLSYRNGSVDPTTGPRVIRIEAVCDVGITQTLREVVEVTAEDDPMRLEVHDSTRHYYFPIGEDHGKQLEAALGTAALESLVTANQLCFADTVDVVDDDTTFFSSGHMTFTLYGSDLFSQLTVLKDVPHTDESFLDWIRAENPKPCRDQGCGIFLDIPQHRTKYGICMIPKTKAAASAATATTETVVQYDLFDDGHFQGTVSCTSIPAIHGSFVRPVRQTQMGTSDGALSEGLQSDDLSAATPHPLDNTIEQSPFNELLLLSGGANSVAATETLSLYSTVRVDFATSNTGATVDTVQELCHRITFVDQKRYPRNHSVDFTERFVVLDVLVGATTGRRDILGQLLPESSVNQPLGTVIRISSRPSFARYDPLPPAVAGAPPTLWKGLPSVSYRENSGIQFLFDGSFDVGADGFSNGGFVKIEILAEGRDDAFDRLGCVDRQEVIAYQRFEHEQYEAMRTAGEARKCTPSSTPRPSVSPRMLPTSARGNSQHHLLKPHSFTLLQPDPVTSTPYSDYHSNTKYGAIHLVQNPVRVQFDAEDERHPPHATPAKTKKGSSSNASSHAKQTPAKSAHVARTTKNFKAFQMREFSQINLVSSPPHVDPHHRPSVVGAGNLSSPPQPSSAPPASSSSHPAALPPAAGDVPPAPSSPLRRRSSIGNFMGLHSEISASLWEELDPLRSGTAHPADPSARSGGGEPFVHSPEASLARGRRKSSAIGANIVSADPPAAVQAALPAAIRKRSVMFANDVLAAVADAGEDEEDVVDRSETTPAMHATLLAASGRRRSLLRGRTGSTDSSNTTAGTTTGTVAESGLKRRLSRTASISGQGGLSRRPSSPLMNPSAASDERMLQVERTAQELLWANRMKKILRERADSFLFLLNKACAKLVEDRVEHLAFFGLEPKHVDGTDQDVTVRCLSVENQEVATTVTHLLSSSCVIILNPNLPITPQLLTAITRTVAFENRNRDVVSLERLLRVSLHKCGEGTCQWLFPIRMIPFDDPTEITIERPLLHWRHMCSELTAPSRQAGLKNTAGAGGAGALRSKMKKLNSVVALTGVHQGGPPMSKEGLGMLRLLPDEFTVVYDADTTHWDGGSIEITVQGGGTMGDCLALLAPEKQVLSRLLADQMRSREQHKSRQQSVISENNEVSFGGHSDDCSSEAHSRVPSAAPSRAASVFRVQNMTSSVPESALSPPVIQLGVVEPGDLQDWVVVADPPFPQPSSSHLDYSQHATIEEYLNTHKQIIDCDRTLHIKKQSTGAMVFANVGKIWVARAIHHDGADELSLNKSAVDSHNNSSNAAAGGGVATGLESSSNPPTARLLTANAPPVTPHVAVTPTVVTLLRIDLSPPESTYEPRIDVRIVKLLLSSLAFFNVHPLPPSAADTHASSTLIARRKTFSICLRDPRNPEHPGSQTVAVDCLPSFFSKPEHLWEPIFYPSKSANEGRFEFLFQHLRTNVTTQPDKERVTPGSVIEVFPISGWVPRDTLGFRFTNTPIVLTQDGQLIVGKELVCRNVSVTPNSIRLEVTKECRGATWTKLMMIIGLISYHFDMKDFGKDGAAGSPPPPAPGGGNNKNDAAGANATALPTQDRVVCLQFTDGEKDTVGRAEVGVWLQRVSTSTGIVSDQ